ncbi:MAG TPA: glycosyltransferase family A protein [Solirubrobacteraceae bacterium]
MTTVDGPGARIPRLVSVIVPSYDPGPELAEQLAAVSAQDHPGAVEILVAHNGPGPVPVRSRSARPTRLTVTDRVTRLGSSMPALSAARARRATRAPGQRAVTFSASALRGLWGD